jgi:hypothetical protein
MNEPQQPIYRFVRPLALVGLFVLVSTVAACGVLGGGEEGEDESFPEPPGRPSSSVEEMEERPAISRLAAPVSVAAAGPSSP